MSGVFVIAEIGCNHNGSKEIAKRMIDAAIEAGVSAVKFQTFKSEELISRYAAKAEYQKVTTGADGNQLEMTKKLELSYADQVELMGYCEQKGIKYLSAPFDLDSIDFLANTNIEYIKIPSGEINNPPYLRKVNKLGKPVILSTGMSTMDEVAQALEFLTNVKVSLLHCTTEYPCPFESVNLKAMVAMKNKFGLPVGYSDHTPGIEVAVAAVAMGATIIEKHFTLDRNMEGPDHKASVEPHEMKALVEAVRHVEAAMGDGIKKPAPAEIKNIAIARKSIVARRAIRKGEIFSEENITVKRPGTGISPMKWDEVIGTAAMRDYGEDELI